ncbi:MAG: quinone-dependent dihydroorotate dehydrogenase [Chloroflexi bacterium]|nr:quinone-dependent dihydroorotate dehydrogenase [Chloroflexota bacterium]
MRWLYRTFIRPALFAQDSEEIHNRTLQGLAWASRHELVCEAVESFFGSPALPVRLWGLHFPNPVGLAAGMDKQAEALPAWAALGFGFSELGGITWHPQPGNPQPRIFRAIPDEALVNRMGFNNPGAEAFAATLAEWRAAGRWPRHPVGINLGKSKITPLADAAQDYADSLRALWPYADFFVVNVSSPNTPHLRQLQDKAALDEILAAMQEVNRRESARLKVQSAASSGPCHKSESSAGTGSSPAPPPVEGGPWRNPQSAIRNPQSPKPLLVKVAPDLSFPALDEILELAEPRRIAGIVATNTTITRPETSDPALQRIYAEGGGLSGKPLRTRSTEVVRHLFRQTEGQLPIIGVGGIFNAADAWEKITAGASLIQVYTGLVYEGPGGVKEMVAGLQERLAERGWCDLRQAVGMEA